MLIGEQIYFAHFMWSPGNCSCIKCLEKQSYWKWLTPFGLGFYLDRNQASTFHNSHPRPESAETERWFLYRSTVTSRMTRQDGRFMSGLFSAIFPAPEQCLAHRRCKLNMYWINEWVPRKYWGGQKWMSHLKSGRGSFWGFSKTLFVQPKMISFSYFREATSTYLSQLWPVV